ncbi:MAG TPA: glycosyltransferase family 2 protein [Chitinophagaceae bacterium]|nr:glycosyltransferase family 2 protein [Chitinophagaceae bacterium]
MQLSIIIVNYKSHGLLLNCLESLYSETRATSFEVVVIDNASEDNGREIILSGYPQVKWIQMGYNSGFARANNEGIRQSQASVVLLLNADTIIENQAIDNTYNHFMHSDAVACGVQLLNADRTPQISGNYFMKGGLNYLLPLPYIGGLLKWIGNLFGVSKPNILNATGTIEVDWINGAFLMVKKTAIEKAGLMDEDFFLYAEEAEWCSRLMKVGRLCIYGDQKIVHLQGETAMVIFQSKGKEYHNLFDRKGLQIIVSNLVRIRKQFGTGWLMLIVIGYLLDIFIFPIGLIIENIFRGGKGRYTWKEVRGYLSNMRAMLGWLPRILRNKPDFYKVL